MPLFLLVSDDQWAAVEDMLPRRSPRRGRPYSDGRIVLEGLMYRARSGCGWRSIPRQFGPSQTLETWRKRLVDEGRWAAVIAALEATARPGWSTAVDPRFAEAHRRKTGIRHLPGGWIELIVPQDPQGLQHLHDPKDRLIRRTGASTASAPAERTASR